MKRIVAVLIAVLTIVAGAGCSSGDPKPATSELNDRNPGSAYLGAGLDPAQPRPNFTLTDTTGKTFAFGSRTAGHPTFLYFGYTNCPDVCPETMADIGIALSKVPASISSKAYVVFVSTDVEHDTPAVIAQWLANFTGGSKARFVGLRGTQAQVDAAQAAAHIAVATDGGQTHSAQALLYGPDDYARVTFLQSVHEQQQMIHDLKVVARATS